MTLPASQLAYVLKDLVEIKSFYKQSILPYEKMTKYFPNDRIQVWKASYSQWLVVDVQTFRGIIICSYLLALQVKEAVTCNLARDGDVQ